MADDGFRPAVELDALREAGRETVAVDGRSIFCSFNHATTRAGAPATETDVTTKAIATPH